MNKFGDIAIKKPFSRLSIGSYVYFIDSTYKAWKERLIGFKGREIRTEHHSFFVESNEDTRAYNDSYVVFATLGEATKEYREILQEYLADLRAQERSILKQIDNVASVFK